MTKSTRSSAGTRVAGEAVPPLIPEHRLLRLIGEGASGRVWLARNALGTYRAVKVVQREAFEDEQGRRPLPQIPV